MRFQGLDLRPVFSTLARLPGTARLRCKTRTHLAPVPSRVPTPRQPIPGITQGLCFLGYPTPLRHTVGYLLWQRRRATGG